MSIRHKILLHYVVEQRGILDRSDKFEAMIIS